MKLVELKCKNCNAKLKVNEELKEATCNFCGATFKIDDEVKHIKYDDMEQSGYEFEKGKIRAREEAEQAKIDKQNAILQARYEKERKKKNLKWWIIGWIFCFPIPLTALIWKSNWGKNKKIIATAILWIVILIIGAINPSDTSNNQNNNTNNIEIKVNNIFIEKYNSYETAKIENIIEYDAQDKESGYYRTEFRLNAYNNNSSIHGTIGNDTVDLINYGSLGKKDKFRFYASAENENQMRIIFKNTINIIDNSIKDEDINKEIEEAIRTKDVRFNLKGNVEGGYIIYKNDKWEILIDSNIDFAK